MRTAVLVVLMLAFAGVAFAAHPSFSRGFMVNLDNDSAREGVIARNHVSFDHEYRRGILSAYDDCAGQRQIHELTPGSDVNSQLDLLRIQGSKALGRPGVLFVVHYSGGVSIARVTRLRRSPNKMCPTPANLFEYSTERPPRQPRGDNVIVDITLTAGEYARAPGREVRLVERYGKSSAGPVTEIRRTDFRYRRAQRRYVELRSVLLPGP